MKIPAFPTIRRFPGLIPLLASALLFLPAIATAAPIDSFGIDDGPLISVQSLLVAYDADSNSLFVVDLNADGTFDEEDPQSPLSIDGTGLNIILSIDGTGVLSGGSFELEGTIDELGYTSGMLLTAEAIGFGFFENEDERGGFNDELQLLFAVNGGDAAGMFGSVIALSLTTTGFLGDFGGDFVNDGSGQAMLGNSAVVPLPGAIWLLASALTGLAVTRRRQRR